MIAAGIISFLIKPVYEIDTIIQPGKFIVENQAGNFEEVVVETPQQIADKVTHKSYDALIATKLNLNENQLPELKARNIGDTLLTRIWLEQSDVPLGAKILQALVTFLEEDIDSKIEIELDNIDTKIKTDEIEKERRLKQIEILNNKLKIIGQRKTDIAAELKSIKTKIDELEKEQMAMLKKANRSDMESLGLLLYSNEIQQSLQSYDLLNEKLKNERLAEEDVHSQLQLEEANISKINTAIDNLSERKGRIDKTKVVKRPTASIDPVYPRKKRNVLMAGVLGFAFFVFLSFFISYLENAKKD